MWWVYVLRGRDGRNYVGMTQRLRRRIAEHDTGRTPADAGKGPFELIYRERCPDASSARERERFLKSGAGREWLKALLTNDRTQAPKKLFGQSRGVAQSG